MLPVKKIYIDSRHRTPDSVDASNFKYELPPFITASGYHSLLRD